MAHIPKDWRFLRTAWVYALVLSGRSSTATELVLSVLRDIGGRHDVVTSRRRRRLFFAKLLREAGGLPRLNATDFEGGPELHAFHGLQEPGRSALALLYFRCFAPEQLADVLGRPEKELPGILAAARAELASHPPA